MSIRVDTSADTANNQSTAKPNVIWVFVDQMRAQAMSHRGDPNVATPHLDRLATNGISFDRAVSGAPLCTPFRGSLLTSRYPHDSSVPGLGHSLSAARTTVAHAFNEQGYRTCWIGKWHLDGHRPDLDPGAPHNQPKVRKIPAARRGGFRDWWAYENNNNPYDCYVHTGDDKRMTSFRLPEYETDSLTDLLLDYIAERAHASRTEPFFAVLSVQPPHNPYVAPAENMARYNPAALRLRPNVPAVPRVIEQARRELAGYYAAVERIDWNVGRIMRKLRETGLDQTTYVMFFSDHGDMLGSHGQFRKTVPWEESIRIPFIIGGGGIEAQNRRPMAFEDVINHVDIAPTTLGLCHIAPPEEMVGFDYSASILTMKTMDHTPDSAYIGIPEPSPFPFSVDRPYRGVVTRDNWKYVAFEGQPWCLYNLNEDPYEQVNLAVGNQFRARRLELHERLQQWIADTGDQFSLGK